MEIKTFTVQDRQGGLVIGATAYLYYPGGSVLVTGLINENGTPLAQPMQSDDNGQIRFGAPDGVYNLRVLNGEEWTSQLVQFLDVAALDTTIDGINAEIDGHIGAGGTAHATATEVTPGFMSDEDKAILVQLSEGGLDMHAYGMFSGAEWGIVGGVGVDESENVMTAINAIGNGGGRLIIRAQNPEDPIYLGAPVPIESSNLTIHFQGQLSMGSDAYVRVNGGLGEIVRPGMSGSTLSIAANSYTDGEGRLVLPMSPGHGAFLEVDDRITVRGENNKFGLPYDKQTTVVVAIDGDIVTCADEPVTTYQPTYPDSEWPADLTTGTTIAINAYARLTTDAVRGDRVLHVANTDYFAVGKLLYINDARTEADMMDPVVTNLKSMCNMEIAEVIAIDEVANTVTLDRALSRDYPVIWGGGAALMVPVTNTHIIADNVSWAAPQPSRRNSIFAINYSDSCSIRIGYMEGRSGRLGAAARVGYSYKCWVEKCNVDGAYGFASAEGYGLTLYYSTLCNIYDCYAVGGRHNYLLQSDTLCKVYDNYSGDDYISGIDLHGANCYDCEITGNTVTLSESHAPGVTNNGGIRNGNTSHTIGDHYTLIEGNTIINYRGTLQAGIDVSPSSRDVIVRNNKLIDVGIGFRHYKVGSSITPAQHSNRVTIENNIVLRAAVPTDISNRVDNSYWDEVIFNGNTFIDCGAPVLIEDIPVVEFYGNKYYLDTTVAGQPAFDFDNIADLRVEANKTKNSDLSARASNCGTAIFVRNYFGGSVTTSTVTDGGGNTSIVDVLNGDTAGAGGGGPFTTADISDFQEAVEDRIGASLIAGNANISITYDDVTGKTSISAAGSAPDNGNPLTGLSVPAGDSRTRQNWSYTNTVPATLARSPLAWFEAKSRRVRMDHRYIQGISGYTVAQLRALFEGDVANEYGFAPSNVPLGTLWVLRIGTNTISGGTKADVDNALIDHKWIVDWMTNRGDTVMVVAEWPRVAGGSSPLNTTGQKLMQFYVEALKRLYRGRKRVHIIDVWKRAADPASTTGDPISGMLNPDGLHNSIGIAYVEGTEEAAVAKDIGMPIIYFPTSTNADLYDATLNPNGNIINNPMLQGSDATTGANATGIEPTDWNLDASTDLSVVGSRETITFFDGETERTEDAFKVVISGTPAATGLYARVRQSGLLSKVAAGDIIEGGVEYLVADGHTNLAAIGVVIDPAVTADQVHGMTNTGGTNSDQPMPSQVVEQFYACTRTPRYQVPGTLPASLSFDFRVRCCVAGVAFSATVWFISASLRKVTA